MGAAKDAVKAQLDKIPASEKAPAKQAARRDLQKMLNNIDTAAKAANTASSSCKRKCKEVGQTLNNAGSAALRADMQEKKETPEALFKKLAGKSDRIAEKSFTKRMSDVKDLSLSAIQMKLLWESVEVDGISRRAFLAFTQQFYVVIKAMALTEEFDVDSKIKPKRKVELEELIEVLEGPRLDAKSGLSRVRGKSVKDCSEGWLTLKGNQGTPFLKEVDKPFYALTTGTTLEQEDGSAMRKMLADEVIEVIEGPKQEKFPDVVKARGKKCGEGSVTGWLTIKDKRGLVYAEASSMYKCVSPVAITDGQDVATCKVLRKLAEGEIFTMLEGPVKDESSGIERVKGKMKDDKVGWVTVKGNAGTVYAAASKKHWTILRDTELQKQKRQQPGVAAKSDEKYLLKAGDNFEALESPFEEVVESESRVKGRVLGDGSIGWMAITKENVKSWKASYKCSHTTKMQDACNPEGAGEVREIQAGEVLQLIDGPSVEGKLLRVRCRADRDGKIGWLSISDADGKKLLK